MSDFQLGIFDDLGPYLETVIRECGGNGIDGCSPEHIKVCERYYLQKYYTSESTKGDANDIAAPFTNAVIKLAQTFRQLDVSAKASPTFARFLHEQLSNWIVNAKEGDITYNGAFVKVKKNIFNLENMDIKQSETNLKSMQNVIDALNKSVNDINTNTLDKLKQHLTMVGVAIDNEIRKQFTPDVITGKTDFPKKVLTLLKGISEREKTLFLHFFDVMKINENKVWEVCSIEDIDTNNLAKFRINAKTTILAVGITDEEYTDEEYTVKPSVKPSVNLSGGAIVATPVPLITKYFPYFYKQHAIRYNYGTETLEEGTSLRHMFIAAYQSGFSVPNFDPNAPSTPRPNLAAIVKDVITADVMPKAYLRESKTDKIEQQLRGIWHRHHDNDGKVFWSHRLSDGSQVRIGPDDESFDNEVRKTLDKCVGFSNNKDLCAKFLQNLNNTTELANIVSQMTEDVLIKTVADLHPQVALTFLKSFGFHRKICKDSVSGKQLTKVQTVEEWLKKYIETKFQDERLRNQIKGNAKLLRLLDLLTQLVNGNPSILNDGVDVTTEESVGKIIVPEDLDARNIRPVSSKSSSKPVLSWDEIKRNMNKVYSSFSKGLTFDGLNTNSPFGLDNLFPSMVLPTSAHVFRGMTHNGIMSGGTHEEATFLTDHNTTLEYSRSIVELIQNLLAKMRDSGKQLDENDKKSLTDKLARFADLERQLFDTAKNIQKYAQLVKIVGDDKNARELVNEAHIQRYVDKYNNLLSRYERTGDSFSTLASLLKDCCEGKKECETNGEI